MSHTAETTQVSDSVLEFKDLDVKFRTEFGRVHAVKGLNLDVRPGEVVALVGESGSGKSVTATTALGLLPKNASIGGETIVGEQSIGKLGGNQLRRVRGSQVAMVFQEPMTALNPVIRVGEQLTEAMEVHGVAFGREAWARAVDLLKAVGIPNAERRASQFPHELSGGMRQRVVIAMALSCDPAVIIADEPTTALDVTIQAQILDLLKQLQAEHRMAILLITHDLGIVAESADDVAIMYAGKIVEQASVNDLFDAPKHPYTLGLFNSLPRLDEPRGRLRTIEGRVPAATHFPPGCRFHTRCRHAMEICRTREPRLDIGTPEHGVACWLHDEEAMREQGLPAGIPESEEAAR